MRRVGWTGSALCAAQLLTGCYSYRRLDGAQPLPTGTDVAVEITDRGRVDLANALGPSPQRVEGRLVAATDSTLTLAVREVTTIGGAHTPWVGEQVVLPRSGIAAVDARRLSRGRTAVLAGAIVGGVLLFVLTRALTGSGSGSDNRGESPGGGQQS